MVSAPGKRLEVLIASYNTRELLRACLTSAFDNSPKGGEVTLEVAVFDNGSHDGSADMVESDFPAVRLLRSPTNVGFVRANNSLAASSTADYLMLLNSDTVWQMDLVTPLLTKLESDSTIRIVGPMLLSLDGSVQPSSQLFPTLRFDLALMFGRRLIKLIPPLAGPLRVHEALGSIGQRAMSQRELHDAEHLWATCWLIRRSEVVQHGLFDERFLTYDEDLDYCRRIAETGGRLVWVPEAHLVHLGSKSTDVDKRIRLQHRGRFRYYRIHHGLGTAVAYGAMVLVWDALKRVERGWQRFRVSSTTGSGLSRP